MFLTVSQIILMTAVRKPDQTQRNSYQGFLSSLETYFWGECLICEFRLLILKRAQEIIKTQGIIKLIGLL